MLGKQIEHMIQKRYIGLYLGYPHPIDLKSKLDIGLIRGPGDACHSCALLLFRHD
jgi:hypothetical protein